MTAPQLKHKYFGAFAITPEILRGLGRHLDDFARGSSEPSVTLSLTVLCSGQPPAKPESIDELTQLRNTRSAPIGTIYLMVQAKYRAARVVLDASGNYDRAAIVVDGVSDSADSLLELERAVSAEAKNCRRWFWRLRSLSDASGKLVGAIPWWLRIGVGSAIVAVGVGVGLWTAVRQARWRDKLGEVIAQVKQAGPEGLQGVDQGTLDRLKLLESAANAPVTPLLIQLVIFSFVGFVAGWLGPRLLSKMFPRMEFAIGDGVARIQGGSEVRKYVLGTILLAGIVLPVVRRCVLYSDA